MNPLWLKSWCECRYRYLLVWLLSGVVLFDLALFSLVKRTADRADLGEWVVLFYLGAVVPIAALVLAGSGVNTQTSWGMAPGLHPSTGFLLSMPVRRSALLWTRASMGAALLLSWVVATHLILIQADSALGVPGWSLPLSTLPAVAVLALLYFGVATWLTVLFDELWSSIIALTMFGMAAGYSLAGGPGWANVITYMRLENGYRQVPQTVFCLALTAGFLGLAQYSIRKKEY